MWFCYPCRFLSKEILTVREAAWLTDNTYKYEDVVHMMGEIAATVYGSICGYTALDYLELLQGLVSLDVTSNYLMRYICDLSLLEADTGSYSHALVACSSFFLSQVSLETVA